MITPQKNQEQRYELKNLAKKQSRRSWIFVPAAYNRYANVLKAATTAMLNFHHFLTNTDHNDAFFND